MFNIINYYYRYFEPAGVVSWPGRGVLIARDNSSDLYMSDEEGTTWDTFPIDPVPGRLPSPYGLSLFPQSRQFLLTHRNDVISIHDKYGVLVTNITSPGINWYIATDESRRRFLATDCLNHCVKVFSAEGRLVRKFGGPESGDGSLRSPHGVCVDSQGNILVSDSQNNRVSLFSPDGRFIKHVLTQQDVTSGVTCDSMTSYITWSNQVTSGVPCDSVTPGVTCPKDVTSDDTFSEGVTSEMTWPKGMTFDDVGRLVVAAGRKIYCFSLSDERSE